MKEIVDRILKEEDEARRKIEQARQLGQSLVVKAQSDHQKIIEEVVAKVNQQVAEKTAQSREEFISQKEKALRQLQEQLDSQMQAKDKLIPTFAEKIFFRIIAIED
jgi:vacuolar-type H+-ATPase subunit H